ncbi:MAG: sel1 repeat family protein [archaeon]|nr:sel1 repeat family protein [archaeon]
MSDNELPPQYQALVDSGEAEKIHTVANLYFQGLVVTQDKRRAAELYGTAADRGYVQAMLRMGIMLMEGDGIEQDYREAAKYFLRASERGNADAMYLLALLYADGKGVDRIPSQAAHWLFEAAKGGSHGAMVELAIWLRDGENYIQTDREQRVYWLMKACLDNYAPAMYELGCMYAFGESVKKDVENAKLLLRHAVLHGDEDAQEALDALENGATQRP